MTNNNDFQDVADSPDASYWPEPADEFELAPDMYIKVQDALNAIGRALLQEGTLTDAQYNNLNARISRFITQIPDGEPVVPASKAAAALRYALALVIESASPKLEAKCMAIAVGLTFKDNSMTEIASKHGVSKQAVSKRIREFQEQHGISASLWNKRAGTRAEYNMTNSRRTKI